jgi:SAM-dependent methyltransferase
MRAVATETVETCITCGGTTSSVVAHSIDFEYRTCDNEFEFRACDKCGHIFLRNRPLPVELNVIYPPNYIPHHFDEHLGPLITRLRNFVQARKIKPLTKYLSDSAVVIDVGPGNGEFLHLLRQHGRSDWELWGVDFSDAVIRQLRTRGFKGVCARFETVEWDASPVDAIVMNQLIEHLDDPSAAVIKAYDILKPGGVLFIETPSTDAWDYRLFRRRYWGGWHTPRHWHLFRVETLSDLVRRSGFEVVETKHILSPNFWLQSIHHFLGERVGTSRLARLFDVSVLPSLLAATAVDAIQVATTGRTSNFRLVAQKPG